MPPNKSAARLGWQVKMPLIGEFELVSPSGKIYPETGARFGSETEAWNAWPCWKTGKLVNRHDSRKIISVSRSAKSRKKMSDQRVLNNRAKRERRKTHNQMKGYV